MRVLGSSLPPWDPAREGPNTRVRDGPSAARASAGESSCSSPRTRESFWKSRASPLVANAGNRDGAAAAGPPARERNASDASGRLAGAPGAPACAARLAEASDEALPGISRPGRAATRAPHRRPPACDARTPVRAPGGRTSFVRAAAASFLDVLENQAMKLQKPGIAEAFARRKFVTPGGQNGAPGRQRALSHQR